MLLQGLYCVASKWPPVDTITFITLFINTNLCVRVHGFFIIIIIILGGRIQINQNAFAVLFVNPFAQQDLNSEITK